MEKVFVETCPDLQKEVEERIREEDREEHILEEHFREQEQERAIELKLLAEEKKYQEQRMLAESCREEVVGDVDEEEEMDVNEKMDVNDYERLSEDDGEVEEERITDNKEVEEEDRVVKDGGEGKTAMNEEDSNGEDSPEDSNDGEGSGSETEEEEDSRHKCNKCPKTFAKASNLTAHHAYVHAPYHERRFVCENENCDERFVKKRDVMRHLRNKSCNKVSKNGKKIGRTLGQHSSKKTAHHNRRKSKEPTVTRRQRRAQPTVHHNRQPTTISQHRRAEPKLLGEAVVNLARIDIAEYDNNNEVEVDRFMLEHDLGAAIVFPVIGNFGRASKEAKHPFKNCTEVMIRSWVNERRLVGPQTPNENRVFAEHLFELGDFASQLGRCQGSKERVIELIEMYIPLVIGEEELEIFLLPPGTYKDDSGGFGIGCGIRRPHGKPPLKPGPQYAVYGDLMRINDDVWKGMEDWQLFSTMTIADGRSTKNGTHLLLGPLQFVSG